MVLSSKSNLNSYTISLGVILSAVVISNLNTNAELNAYSLITYFTLNYFN